MRLLLVGFSEQNVKTLKVFCQRNFDAVECDSVGHQFSEGMRLSLPTLTAEQASADAYMIFLEGVGMSMFKSEHIKSLMRFIASKPTILVTRKQSNSWSSHPELMSSNILHLDAPYSSESIKDKLDELLRVVFDTQNMGNGSINQNHIESSLAVENGLMNKKKSFSKLDAKYQNQAELQGVAKKLETQTEHEATEFTEKIIKEPCRKVNFKELYESVLNNPNTKIIDDALSTYFPKLYEQSLIRNTMFIWAQTQPLKVTAGAHEFYVNSTERRAVVRQDISRLVDFVGIAGRYLFADTMSIRINKVSSTDYKKITDNLLASGYRNYSLYTLIWQLADTVLQSEFEYNEHDLRMKVVTLPNFTVIDNVPDYVYPVLSSCLSKPRSIPQLQTLFPHLSVMTLNRVLVMAMISNILDPFSLYDEKAKNDTNPLSTSSHSDISERNASAEDESDQTTNKSIKKAQQSGFFKRLLKKLTF